MKIPASPYTRPDYKNATRVIKEKKPTDSSSPSSSPLRSINVPRIHINGCSFPLTNICLCKDVMALEKRQRERSMKKQREDNSESFNSDIEGSIINGDLLDIQHRNTSDSPSNSTEFVDSDNDSFDFSDVPSKNLLSVPGKNCYEVSHQSTLSSVMSNANHDVSICISSYMADDELNSNIHESLNSFNDDLDPSKSFISYQDSQIFSTLATDYSKEQSEVMSPLLRKLMNDAVGPGVEKENANELLSRLSQSYIEDPYQFKDKLLSIIDEKINDSGNNVLDCSFLVEEDLLDSVLQDEDELDRSIMLECAKKRKSCFEIDQQSLDLNSTNSKNPGDDEKIIDDSHINFKKIRDMFEFIGKSKDYCNYITKHKKNIRKVTERVMEKSFEIKPHDSDHLLKPSALRAGKNYFNNKESNVTAAHKSIRPVAKLTTEWISRSSPKRSLLEVSPTLKAIRQNNTRLHLPIKNRDDSIYSRPQHRDSSESKIPKSPNGWEVFLGRKPVKSPVAEYIQGTNTSFNDKKKNIRSAATSCRLDFTKPSGKIFSSSSRLFY